MSESSQKIDLNVTHMEEHNFQKIQDKNESTNDIKEIVNKTLSENPVVIEKTLKCDTEINTENFSIIQDNLVTNINASLTDANLESVDNVDSILNNCLPQRFIESEKDEYSTTEQINMIIPKISENPTDPTISNHNLGFINSNNSLVNNSLLQNVDLSAIKDNLKTTSNSSTDITNQDQISTEDSCIVDTVNNINTKNIQNNEDLHQNSKEAEQKLAYQEKIIEENSNTIKFLEEKCQKFEQFCKDLEFRLELALKQKENAVKEKENMVIRYAVGEKNVIKEKQQKELAEKKLKETQKENEILSHKIQTMISEKSRICQMLDNKCYELKNCQQELDKTKECLSSLETKIKWSQNSLKSEIEAHRECQAKNEALTQKLQEVTDKIEGAKKEAEDIVKDFKTSQENKAYVLDQQVKEQQASLILLKYEKTDRDQLVKNLQAELTNIQNKQKELISENNNLSQKVQQLERERLDTEQKLRELRTCADQQKNNVLDLQTKNVQLDQLKMQLMHEQGQLASSNEQIELLKQRNQELESDMAACRIKETELLLFTQQLTDKNVRLQSEFSSLEAKVQQLSTSQTNLKRQLKEQETKLTIANTTLAEEKASLTCEVETLKKDLEECKKSLEKSIKDLEDQKGENMVVKRKYELSFREVNKELQNCRKKLEQYESMECASSNASSNSPTNSHSHTDHSSDSEQTKNGQLMPDIDKDTLIQHIIKLQKASAKKSEKIDFLEEHVNTLVLELQKKTKLLQGYILREQSGTLTSNSMDKNKAKLAKQHSIMASLYSSRPTDDSLTLELSLDINRKLQAVLEDALLKNITLKENVDTLGKEIDRLNNLSKSSMLDKN